MEIFTSTLATLAFSSQQSFLVATSLTLLSLLLAFFTLRLKSPKSLRPNNIIINNNKNIPNKPSSAVVKPTCSCCCSCNDVSLCGSSETRPASESSSREYANGGGEAADMVVAATAAASAAEKQTGASMMEQLVPEITTHALSYLDYPSLCRLSMTNSLMRKAANDDSAWKALYHKDFTLEQDTVIPANGWKAYYAATRAVVNVNMEFFNIIRERLLPAMSLLWLNADYVKCTHANGEVSSGYDAVIQSWQLAFWEQGVDFQVRDVRARVLTDMAWVTMKTYVDMDIGAFSVTNVFEFHNGRWYMVHHHSSVMLLDGEVDQQMGHP
uniref:F-box domain-containing protein n=1 Tax=Rhizophora mucronata TaxID=61149 RepID=A0A2P2IJ67_RHIMU